MPYDSKSHRRITLSNKQAEQLEQFLGQQRVIELPEESARFLHALCWGLRRARDDDSRVLDLTHLTDV